MDARDKRGHDAGEIEPPKQSHPPGRLKPDPGPYGLNDFAEHIVWNIFIGLEHDMPAVRDVRELWLSFDLIRNLVENADIFKHDFKIDMKIAGQFIGPEDIENGVMGTRFG